VKAQRADLVKRIEDTNDLSQEDEAALKTVVEDWKKSGSY